MTDEQKNLNDICAAIESLPKPQRDQIDAFASFLRDALERNPLLGFSLARVGAELAAMEDTE